MIWSAESFQHVAADGSSSRRPLEFADAALAEGEDDMAVREASPSLERFEPMVSAAAAAARLPARVRRLAVMIFFPVPLEETVATIDDRLAQLLRSLFFHPHLNQSPAAALPGSYRAGAARANLGSPA